MLRLLKDYNENTMEIISEILDLIVEGTLELIGSKKGSYDTTNHRRIRSDWAL